MTGLPLAYGVSKRLVGRFPELLQHNVFAERAPAQQEKTLALIARPGLDAFRQVGTAGPLRGIVQKPGLFGNDVFIVANTSLVRMTTSGATTTLSGAVAGTGRVRMAIGRDGDDNDQVRIATGDALYTSDGATVSEEDFPDATKPGAQDVEFLGGFWVALEAGTDVLWYKVPGDPAALWQGLDFASAEYQPDKLNAVRAVGSSFWFFGETTTEVWVLTGATDTPIQPLGGLKFDIGCRARDTVATIGGSVLWVDDRCQVQLSSGGEPAVVSDNGISELIRDSATPDLRAWTYSLDGHAFYVLTLGSEGTLVYDLTTRLWSRFTSEGERVWRAAAGVEYLGQILALDSRLASNQIWRLNPDSLTDDGDEIECRFTAYVEAKEGRGPCSSLELICATGFGPRSGQGSDPLMTMRYSDDEGKSWGAWKPAGMGATGASVRVRWRRLGMIKAPYGRVFQFRCSDPVVRRFSDVRMNAG